MGHGLAVEDNLFGVEDRQSFCDSQELLRPVPAVSAPQAHLIAVLSGDDPIAVVLDLVQPLRPARRLVREGGLARLGATRRTMPLAARGERINIDEGTMLTAQNSSAASQPCALSLKRTTAPKS